MGGLQAPLWRAIAVFRVAALAYVAVLVGRNFDRYAHPLAAWVALGAMAAWTALTAYAYAQPRWRRWPLLLTDLVVTMAVLLASPWVVGRAELADGAPTLTVAWLAAPVLAWAVAGGRRWGAAAALALGAADIWVRDTLDQSNLTGATLMLLAGVAVGHVARLTGEAEDRLQRAVALEAATRERERLARDIHDSVLQVLAMVQRRGAALGGEAGELARLAGEQEVALRSLVSGTAPAAVGSTGPAGRGDLSGAIAALGSPSVSIAGPAEPVLLAAPATRELAAAVRAALDNVAQHCPQGTKAWVLVEQEPDVVTVTIRDDGPGMAPGRLAEAAAQGRLGFAHSIRGRVVELGGTVAVTSAPGAGTELELRVPRRLPGAGGA